MFKLGNNVHTTTSATDGDLFWIKMGRFFASKEIRKQFDGYPLNDSNDHLWFVILKKEEVVSFLGVTLEKVENKGEIWITEMYTTPEHRQKGLSSTIFKEVLKWSNGIQLAKSLKVIAHPNSYSHNIFKKNGFEVEKMKGAYTYYTKEINKSNETVAKIN